MQLTIDNLTDGIFHPSNKLKEGAYRNVYSHGDYVVKVLKSHRRKNYGLFHIDFPMAMYNLLTFGIQDFNAHEMENYQRLMEIIHPRYAKNFAKVYVVGRYNGMSVSLCELVRDANGSPSNTLAGYSSLESPEFWRTLEDLSGMLLEIQFYPMDLKPENIMVKKDRGGNLIPVLIDLKRVGARTYPFQVWLNSELFLAEKMKRKFKSLRRQHESQLASAAHTI